ncbi:MAG TPA: hypothetical protein VMO47_19105, partial [Rhodothermales bacterium]|nr:hypothetical protein [Rhodothermales bacterium]
AKRSKGPIIAAIAAVLILGIAGTLWYLGTRDTTPAGPGVDTTVEVPGGTGDPHSGPLGPGQGALLLAANRGELAGVVDADTDVELALDLSDRSLPLRLHLDSGTYEIQMLDEQGQIRTETVTVVAGQEIPVRPQFAKPDLDKLVDDILRP